MNPNPMKNVFMRDLLRRADTQRKNNVALKAKFGVM